MEIVYENYRKLIYKRAWAWSSITGFEFEELISEGNIVFCRSKKTYDESKSSFSTYLYNSLNIHFRNMFQRKRKNSNIVDHGDISSRANDPERMICFKSALETLSDDGKFIINLVLDELPDKLKEICKRSKGGSKISKHSITDYLTSELDWSYPRCWNCYKEIKFALKE